jgi:sucrose-6F-phosphate phosphohydrolase
MSIRLFSSDLDGTLLGNPESTLRFKEAWESLPDGKRPLLVYNSGRLLPDILQQIQGGLLPTPDWIIGGVGTQLWEVATGEENPAFSATFDQGWDLAVIERVLAETPGLTRQPPGFLHPYKSSWYLHRATPEHLQELQSRLRDAGLDVAVVYSSSRDLDVLPLHANKGHALRWLCEKLGIALEETLVAGDTANDSSMFHLPGVKGLVVENAQPELFESVVTLNPYCSTRILADGVIQGLLHYGVISQIPQIQGESPSIHESGMEALFDADILTGLSESERQLIETGYARALVALRKSICPLGFLAASLEDNEVVGTDINYRSVWGRDGCITVINVLYLPDEDIRAACRATLGTLLDHLSPNGQVPANVRIADHTPDYSGVGGIAAIDSGLWLVMAVFHYVRVTDDRGFLEHHAARLQRVMDWLSAHDSNNDGLLEIPEAGDWTDLFGRSYNVLYDEVLWYRANVCYGRILDWLGLPEKAADYLRWGQHIRGEILSSFWPTTAQRLDAGPVTFADRQYSLGDAQYLLAQVSPFGFDWRCDVYANILAFLTNVLDSGKARTAFRFMWGVGVNSPYPVANLYPPVQSGDPDWKPYYLVNLLNLPDHYHNGGLWPFIGGMWVRFIFRLGLRDVACRELLKLAELCRAGTQQEWEFNEWAHGRTGRPMGKRFQCWSAASYLRACHELRVKPDDLESD